MDNCNERMLLFAVINEELEDVGTVHVDEQAACYEIFTPKLRIRVNKSPMSLQIFDKYQKLLFSDYADKGHVSEGTKKTEYKVLRRDEHFFGLGEKTGKMDRRGESYKMWNSDKALLQYSGRSALQEYSFLYEQLSVWYFS